MLPNTTVYAVLHGQITKAILIAVNKSINIAYIRLNDRTVRITPESIFGTRNEAAKQLATT